MGRNLIDGIIPAVVTPFNEDESIDFDAWGGLLDILISSGVHGLFVIGGQGEFFALTEQERNSSVHFCTQTVVGRVPLYVNVGAVTTREAKRLAQAAESEGVDALVVITPYYLKPSADELADHYIAICQAVRTPVLAYNIPERSGIELTPATLKRIAARCENFVGLKDSGGKLELIPEYRSANLTVYVGRDHMVLPALQLGANGAVAACANVIPRLFVDLYERYRTGDLQGAARLQAMINPLRMAFGWATFPSVVKEAMNMIGVRVGHCRRPVGRLPQETRAKLAAVLNDLQREGYLALDQAGPIAA